MRGATWGVALPASLTPGALGAACLPGHWCLGLVWPIRAPFPALSLSLPLCHSSGSSLFNTTLRLHSPAREPPVAPYASCHHIQMPLCGFWTQLLIQWVFIFKSHVEIENVTHEHDQITQQYKSININNEYCLSLRSSNTPGTPEMCYRYQMIRVPALSYKNRTLYTLFFTLTLSRINISLRCLPFSTVFHQTKAPWFI